jgi:hypothetical protein
MNRFVLKAHHFLFRAYYKRVPEFFHQWTIIKSISLLSQNYTHNESRYDGLETVLASAIDREKKLMSELSNLRLRASGISQEFIDPLNEIFGTNLKGISKQEREN